MEDSVPDIQHSICDGLEAGEGSSVRGPKRSVRVSCHTQEADGDGRRNWEDMSLARSAYSFLCVFLNMEFGLYVHEETNEGFKNMI